MSRYRLEIDWFVSEPDERGLVMVRAHLSGTDHVKTWGPMPEAVSTSFVRAKRDALHRAITTRTDAIRLFTPSQGTLLQ